MTHHEISRMVEDLISLNLDPDTIAALVRAAIRNTGTPTATKAASANNQNVGLAGLLTFPARA